MDELNLYLFENIFFKNCSNKIQKIIKDDISLILSLNSSINNIIDTLNKKYLNIKSWLDNNEIFSNLNKEQKDLFLIKNKSLLENKLIDDRSKIFELGKKLCELDNDYLFNNYNNFY